MINLVTLCCKGKSEIAERQSKLYILSFRVCGNLVAMAENFWPVKLAVLNYTVESIMDTSDPNFLCVKKSHDDSHEAANEEGEEVETDLQTLLKIVESLNSDFEMFLRDEIYEYELHLPTGKVLSMFSLAMEYIFDAGIKFMRVTMRKKPSDVGSFDMKFFDIGKNLASLYYKTNNRKHKLHLFELLAEI